MSWHVRDCGAKALSIVLGRELTDVKAELMDRFGSFELTGKQMREVLTDLGWRWVNTQRDGLPLPDDDVVLVTTRKGFYALEHGYRNMTFPGAVCGYYFKPC